MARFNQNSITLATEEIGKDEHSLLIYPNPATNQLSIQLPPSLVNYNVENIEIVDVFGRIIQSPTFNLQHNVLYINTETLSAGTYFVKIIQDNNHYNSIFIKQ